MARKLGFFGYAAILLLTAVLAQVGGYAATGISIAGCKLAPKPDLFISSCGSPRFGDYEHDAFWFGTEPTALANLRAADVVFTGSSRVMFGFSTPEIRSYFASRGVRMFNLGFGFEDQQPFFTAIALKYHIHPRVLVIGVDPYFDDRLSLPAMTAMRNDWHEYARTLLKRTEFRVQDLLCRRWVACTLGTPTAFRSSLDGYFVWRDVLFPERERKRTHETRLRDFQVNVPLAASRAKHFLQVIGMDASCVVLVPMPTSQIWPKPDPFKQLADAIGSMYIDADTGDDLSLVDEIHLSYDGAIRFSAEFVRQFDQLPQHCLASPSLQAGQFIGSQEPLKQRIAR